MKYVYKKYVL
jgi:hypothetical protein